MDCGQWLFCLLKIEYSCQFLPHSPTEFLPVHLTQVSSLPRGLFKIMRTRSYYFQEILNFNLWMKLAFLLCRLDILCYKEYLWNSAQNVWHIHSVLRFLHYTDILKALRFKKSCMFLRWPPAFSIIVGKKWGSNLLTCHCSTFIKLLCL